MLIESYLHKLTNTCAIKIETAGTDATEIEIKAIGKEKANPFRNYYKMQWMASKSQND